MKVALAARLRAETTMTVWWIAERLAMGTRGYLNHLLYRRRKLGGEYPISRTDPFSHPFSQGGFSEGGFGGALASGDDDGGGVDRRASGDGTRGYLNYLLYRRRKLGE